MTWGIFKMFYECKNCKIKFFEDLNDMENKDFSICPVCNNKADLVGDSSDYNEIDIKLYKNKSE